VSGAGPLRGALVGCGFFARNHLHGWREVDGVELVAVCDADGARARAAAAAFGVPRAYDDAAAMLAAERPDFVDVAAPPHAHRALVELAAAHGVHVVCQKPLAPTLDDARAMVAACGAAGVRFMVHENFRWQRPMRALRDAAAGLGPLAFGRVSFRSAFDVYAAQPYLATDPRFILYDLGVHLLDLARFFLGELELVACVAQRVNARVRGEDAATVLLRSAGGAACVVDMSYAARLERELFPQTLVHLEGALGSATLGGDYALTVVDGGGVRRERAAPRAYPWSAPPAEAIQESVVAIQRHWAECLRAGREPETSGADNLRTLELVFGAYDAADQLGIPAAPAAAAPHPTPT
jgi:predicted dehydrogenase